MIDLKNIKPEIENICRDLSVKKLGLFGSALTSDFSTDSDIDVLVMFDSDKNSDLFTSYFDLKERLQEVFNREVDLVIDKPFKNLVFRKSVEDTRTTIYER